MMDSSSDDILSDLHVVGSIKPYGRLCINNGRLSTAPSCNDSLVAWAKLTMKRWWTHDDRSHSILALQCLVLKLQCLRHYPPILKDLLKNSIIGLDNLKITYKEDAYAISRFSIIQNSIQNLIIKNFEA